jgi:hypothetical protein
MVPLIQPVKWEDNALGRAVERELRSGLELKRQMEREREIVAAKEAEELRNQRTIKGLGKCVATIPHWEYYRMVQKYGHAEVHSRGFIRDFQKRFPHLSPAKA